MSEEPIPLPQGRYAPAMRHGDLVFVSGVTPRREGKPIVLAPANAVSDVDNYRVPLEIMTRRAYAAACSCLENDESLTAVLSMTVYIKSTPDFIKHSEAADIVSQYFGDKYGLLLGARAAVGVNSLPDAGIAELSIVGLAVRSA